MNGVAGREGLLRPPAARPPAFLKRCRGMPFCEEGYRGARLPLSLEGV